MLAPVINPAIHSETRTIEIENNCQIFVKILSGPVRSGRTAIYIHGGGGGGNHTLIERPSRHLINDGFFDRIYLPDRRGDGASSPLTHCATIHEHAEDMARMLNALQETGPLTAMGVSYGGPIALELAGLDPRMERVVLVASSPNLNQNNGIARFLLKSGILRPLMKSSYRANLGKLPPQYPDFDPAYDARRPGELVKMFTDALKHTPRDRMDSMIYSLEATLEEASASASSDLKLDLPVLQVIGEKDEIWGSDLLAEYRVRFPHFRQYRVVGGRIHKDVFLKPDLFYNQLAAALHETLPAN